MNKLAVLFISLLFSSLVNAAGINLVTNGSFEKPNIKKNSWKVFKNIKGWSTTGAGIEIRDNVAGKAFDGAQFAELDSHNNSSIFQNINTIANKQYQLSFAYSPRIRQPAHTNNIEIFWNGSLLDNITGKGGRTNNWTIFNYMVTGTGLDELKFSAAGKNDSLGGNLDAVSVSAVPVPAAAYLFVPALLGFIALRKKAN